MQTHRYRCVWRILNLAASSTILDYPLQESCYLLGPGLVPELAGPLFAYALSIFLRPD